MISIQHGAGGPDLVSLPQEPQEAMAIYVTIHDGEAVLCIAPGDHTVQRWRLGTNSGRRLAADLTNHYLDACR